MEKLQKKHERKKKTSPIPRPKLMRIYSPCRRWVGGKNHTDCVCLFTHRGVSGRMTGHYNNMYAGTCII